MGQLLFRSLSLSTTPAPCPVDVCVFARWKQAGLDLCRCRARCIDEFGALAALMLSEEIVAGVQGLLWLSVTAAPRQSPAVDMPTCQVFRGFAITRRIRAACMAARESASSLWFRCMWSFARTGMLKVLPSSS